MKAGEKGAHGSIKLGFAVPLFWTEDIAFLAYGAKRFFRKRCIRSLYIHPSGRRGRFSANVLIGFEAFQPMQDQAVNESHFVPHRLASRRQSARPMLHREWNEFDLTLGPSIVKITSTLLQPFTSSNATTKPYAPEEAVRYEPTKDGELSKFESSDKARRVRAQSRAGLQRLKDFLLANGGSSRQESVLASLDNFGNDISKGIRGRLSGQIGRIYDDGKRAIDTLCVDVADDTIPLNQRLSVVENLAKELDVCAEGACAHLVIAADEMRMGVFGLKGHARKAWENIFDQSILEFCRSAHCTEGSYPEQELHYVNGYRKHLANSLGLNVRSAGIVPPGMRLRLEEASRFVSETVTADALVSHLAEECLAEVRDHLKDYLDRPLTEAEGWQVYTKYVEALEVGVHSRYGKIGCSVLLDTSARKGTEDAPYSIIDHPALLMRAIARNLMEAGLLEKEKFALEAGEPNGQIRIKRITGDTLYVKEEDNSEVRYRKVELDDADRPDLSQATSLKILKSALMSTTNPDRLRLVDPERVWNLITHAEGDVPDSPTADWIDVFCAVRRYREAHPAGDKFLTRKAGDKIAENTLELQHEILIRLIQNREDALGAQVASSLATVDLGTHDGSNMLHLAAYRGCDRVLNELASKVPDIDDANDQGESALMIAARYGRMNCVRALLQHNAKADLQDASGVTPLMRAASHGHLSLVQELLKTDAQPAAKDQQGWNALHHAVASGGNPDLIEALSPFVGSIDERTNDGNTALMLAASYGRREAVDELLDLDADPTQRGEHGRTALHLAAENGHAHVIETLEGIVKDFDEPDAYGNTSLMLAASNRHAAAVCKLLDLHADPELENDKRETSLHAAADGGDPEIIGLLASITKELATGDISGNTPLMHAAYRGHVAAVRKLLDLGADPNLENSEGLTILHAAACGGSVDLIDELRTYVSEIDKPTKDGRTALMLAAENGHAEAVCKLLDLNANPACVSNSRRTLLHMAAAGGELEIIELPQIIDDGLDEPDIGGNTPLMLAASKGHDAVVRKLQSLGADPRRKNNEGYRPFHFAAASGKVDLMDLLSTYISGIDEPTNDGRTALMMASENGHLDAVCKLLEINANPDRVDKLGCTPLNLAARKGHSGIIEKLYPLVTEPDKGDKDGATPLMLAAFQGHYGAVRSLLHLGANPHLKDNWGMTAFHQAAATGSAEIIDLLCAYVADIEETMNDGRSALRVAAENGRLEAVRALLKLNADPNAEGKFELTALHTAAAGGNPAVIEVLHKAGGLLDKQNAMGTTPLMVSLEARRPAAARELLRLGANPNLKNALGWTAIHYAADVGNSEVIDSTSEYVENVDALTKEGHTALALAVKKRHLGAARSLLNLGATPSHRDQLGMTLFHLAALDGDSELIELMGAYVKSIDELTEDGETALALAVENGSTDAVRKLLQLGASPSHRNEPGLSLFHRAALDGAAELIDLMGKYVKDVDELNDDGDTALALAVEVGSTDAVRKLLELGASPSHRDDELGFTLFHGVALDGNLELIDLMGQYIEDVDELTDDGKTALDLAVKMGHPDAARRLLNLGASLDRKDKHGRSLFHRAALKGDADLIHLLGKYVEDIDVLTDDGKTALFLAVEKGHVAAIRALLKLSADLHFRNEAGITPFHRAALDGKGDLIQLLSQYVEDIDEPTDDGKTALILAAENGHLSAVHRLLELGADLRPGENVGITLLHYAAIVGRPKLIDLISRYVEDIDELTHDRRTA
ncbi:MAG TPA: ankyrin repeat domain-containing protein, partial [Burkholderiaceae bacterium]|nr:ankyrin repeat domain-containing protein [Burkholderiaceae bacterium]